MISGQGRASVEVSSPVTKVFTDTPAPAGYRAWREPGPARPWALCPSVCPASVLQLSSGALEGRTVPCVMPLWLCVYGVDAGA